MRSDDEEELDVQLDTEVSATAQSGETTNVQMVDGNMLAGCEFPASNYTAAAKQNAQTQQLLYTDDSRPGGKPHT